MAKRFNKDNWIDVGQNALKDGGPPSLTIEELCEITGKTRGSFYFHFEHVEAFQLAIANAWKEQFCDEVTSSIPKVLNRDDLLSQLTLRLDMGLEVGIRKLGFINPAVAAIVSEADAARIDWLASLYTASGHFTKEEAEELAKIEYATFVGMRMINPHMSDQDARAIYQRFLKLTGRA